MAHYIFTSYLEQDKYLKVFMVGNFKPLSKLKFSPHKILMQEKYSLVPLATVKLCCRLKVSKLIFVWQRYRYILVESRWISQQWEWLAITDAPLRRQLFCPICQKCLFSLVKSSKSSLITFPAYIGFKLKSKIILSLFLHFEHRDVGWTRRFNFFIIVKFTDGQGWLIVPLEVCFNMFLMYNMDYQC